MATIMRSAAFAALLCLAACKPQETPPVGDACGDPTPFVRELYAQYAEGAKAREYDTIFDDATLALIKRDHDLAGGEVPWLAYDPVCNCQDWENVAVTEVKVTRSAQTVANVAYTNGGSVFHQDFLLACTSTGWRVHDIVVRPENASLRDGLTKAISDRQE